MLGYLIVAFFALMTAGLAGCALSACMLSSRISREEEAAEGRS